MTEWQRTYGQVNTFADRLRWIVIEDYEDEGASALLPLLALAEVLEAVAVVLNDPSPENLSELAACHERLNVLR